MKKLGFGCMRLPMIGNEVDLKQFSQMIDEYMSEGFCYFDTAHSYIEGKSELAIRECLVPRYDRESYWLVDKLTDCFFNKEEDIRPLFEEQLECTGVDYFDIYLMHAQNRDVYKHFLKCNAYETAKALKDEGKIRHLGLSFHDKAEVLEKILSEQPEIEYVQIQFNYADYLSDSVDSKNVYEVARKFNKKILIMEPVKGGKLVNLPNRAKEIFDELGNGSYASYAIRYAASFDGVEMVLSGMSNTEQMRDNISFMKDFVPLKDYEYSAIEKVQKIISDMEGIDCTACRYCVAGCPKNILIPDLFACYNAKVQFKDNNSDRDYKEVYTKDNAKASECIKCGKCEKACPQHLGIRKLLEKVAVEFE